MSKLLPISFPAAAAAARLRAQAHNALHEALARKGISQRHLAQLVDRAYSTVNVAMSENRNLTLDVLAEYLFVMGYELHLTLEPIRPADRGPHGI